MKAKGESWEITEVSGDIQQVLAKLATVQTRSSRMLPFKGKITKYMMPNTYRTWCYVCTSYMEHLVVRT